MIQEKVYTSLMIAKDCTRLSAKKCGFTLESLKEDNRRRAYADMRSMLMHMLRNTTALSYSDIGYIFHRDHSCVIHNVKKVDDLIRTDKGFKIRYDQIRNDFYKSLKILTNEHL
tara:strand:- start:2100 stop:2441 length:342 start_codon:yes stop_codon:yes gene_type:complete